MIGAQTATEARALPVGASLVAFVPVLVAATVVAVALASLDVPATSFRSPDEHASYLFTRTFAETGRLYYTADYLEHDEENLLHPRGALTHEGRAVPFNYLGSSVLYAPFYRLLGENTRYVAIPLALIAVGALAGAGAMLVPRRPWIAWAAVLGVTPIIYYLNRPFLNTLPSLAFASVGLYFLLRYLRSEGQSERGQLLAACGAFALAAFSRYEFVIFETLLVAIVLFQKHGRERLRIAGDMVVFAGVMGVLFVLPVLVLNQFTYGSPSTIGYGLFNDAYYPDRAGSGPVPENLLQLGRSVLLPAYPFDMDLALAAFTRQVLGVAPVFSIVALLGAFSVVRKRALPWPYLAAYVALAIYVFLYRGAGYSWLADSPTANLEASVVRYSLPLYVAFYLLAVYGLAQVRQAHVVWALVGILVLVGVLGALRDVDGSLLHVRRQVTAGEELAQTEILPATEPESIIYTDVFDKVIGPYRNVASWWGGVRGTYGGFFRPDDVARSISRVYPERPVYLYLFKEEFVVPQLEEALRPWRLQVSATETPRLYRVDAVTDGASPGFPPE